VCRHLVEDLNHNVINVDKLTYAGNLASLRQIENIPNYSFYHTDICNDTVMLDILLKHEVDLVMHLAAESHVDRSIDGPADFIETNIVGTFRMLNCVLIYWRGLRGEKAENFRFHHISTDEVFGDLPFDSGIFTETTPYAPSSPYSASKASSDHLVRAWHETYGLPVVLTNCSNNYGSYQFPEKLIPLVILNALDEKPLPVYGKGENVRDWLYVDDHARALTIAALNGKIGESYNIGGNAERTNLSIVETICDAMDRKNPRDCGASYRDLITFVADRPGHDRRYAIDASKIKAELDWQPSIIFEEGIEKTIDWYLANQWWWQPIRSGTYSGARLGTKKQTAAS